MGYGLYIAKIVGVNTSADNRLQIRILPQMANLEESMCPKWPSFFKDELYTGRNGDLVWCVCDDNFDNGYVLGLANYAAYGDDAYSTITINKEEIPLSIPKEGLQDKISEASVQLLGKRINLQDVKVTYWDSNSIHFIERSTGGFIIAYSVGSLLIMRPSEFFLHIGSAEKGPSIKVDSTGISMAADDMKFQSKHIGLGLNPTAKVVVTNGVSAEGGFPSSYVEA